MTSKLQLTPMLDVETPRGRAYAFMVEDAGELSNHMWTCILRDSGEMWTFKNPDIRAAPCETMKVRQDPTSEVIVPGETREQMLGRIGRQREFISRQRLKIQQLERELAEQASWQRIVGVEQPRWKLPQPPANGAGKATAPAVDPTAELPTALQETLENLAAAPSLRSWKGTVKKRRKKDR